MGRLEFHGMEELVLSMEELIRLPEDVLDEMLKAEGEVLLNAQKAKGRAYGVHKTGVTLEAIKLGKPRKTNDGKSISITVRGKNAKGIRNAEVAFINEYGKKGKVVQAPRPFIRDANEEASTEAVVAAEKVYDDWLNSR